MSLLGCCLDSVPADRQEMTELGERVAESSALPAGGRLQLKIQARYITVLRLDGKLHAIDSICFHAGGPLGIGDIEDVNGRACIVCPWHYYKIDVETGDKYYQQVKWENGKMVQGDWASNGVKQRVHKVVEHEGGIYLTLSSAPVAVDSDNYACNAACGDRMMGQGGKPAQVKRGGGGQSVGGDGRLPSGAIIRAAREAAQANNPGAIVGAGAGAPSSSCSRPAPAATATVAEECEEERENSSPVCYMKL